MNICATWHQAVQIEGKGEHVKKFRGAIAMAGLALLALVAGGCGSGGGQNGGEAVKPVDINPRPRDEVRQGGTMRVAIEQFPRPVQRQPPRRPQRIDRRRCWAR